MFTFRGAACVALLLVGAVASADPIFQNPEVGAASTWDGVSLLVDVRALAVITADRLTSWPDRHLDLEQGAPQLVAGRVGISAASGDFTLVARLDLGEPTRPYVDDRFGPLTGALVDDLYVDWHPAQAISVLLGRARVFFSKERQFDEVELPLGAVPFIVDRVAPDRRWGVAAFGDLGAASYAAGAYLDLDALETRARVGDPSQNGAVAFAAAIEWTPRAPMMGSNPVGAVEGARGPLPTPRDTDPWFDTARLSGGAGVVVRLREDGTSRLDGSLSGQLKWRWLSAVVEGLVTSEGGALTGGGYAEGSITPVDPISLTVRGELDQGAPTGEEWAASAGIGWNVTKNRRNRVSLVGWLRRDVERGTAYDGLVLYLQASL